MNDTEVVHYGIYQVIRYGIYQAATQVEIFRLCGQNAANGLGTPFTEAGHNKATKGEKMSAVEGKNYAKKHGSDAQADLSVKDEILKRAKGGKIPCAVAFEMAKDLQVSPAEVGKTTDLLNLWLNKCQLGLFGYKPEKKIVKPQTNVNQDLKDAIYDALVDGKLPCQVAWDIASRLSVQKMLVSGACEAMGIKISACQLGAF